MAMAMSEIPWDDPDATPLTDMLAVLTAPPSPVIHRHLWPLRPDDVKCLLTGCTPRTKGGLASKTVRGERR